MAMLNNQMVYKLCFMGLVVTLVPGRRQAAGRRQRCRWPSLPLVSFLGFHVYMSEFFLGGAVNIWLVVEPPL